MRAVGLGGVLAIALVLVDACSSFDSAPPPNAPDAGADAPAPDAGADAPVLDASAIEDAPSPADVEAGVRCARIAPFTTVRPLDGVNTPDDEAFPRVSADELVIYFHRTSQTGTEIFRASRPSRADAFDPPVRVEGLPPKAREPTLTADELEIVFSLQEGGWWSLWGARRPAPSEPFGAAVRLPVNDDNAHTLAAFFSVDGTELYFVRSPAETGFDLYRVTRAADGGVGAPEALDTLNGNSLDSEPVLSPDRMSLYFYSNRPGSEAVPGSIWVAHRDTPTGPFRTPVRLEELVVDGGYTSPGSVSVDGCRLYFYSDMNRPTTGVDLFVAERSP